MRDRGIKYAMLLENEDFPRIICLVGSIKHQRHLFDAVMFHLTLQGYIVLTISAHCGNYVLTNEDKKKIDELHKRKIDLCDEVYVMYADRYVGESSKDQIEYAKSIGVPVKYISIFSKGYPGYPTEE